MKINSDFEELLQCLNHSQANYLIIGGYAFIHYAEPRYTKDIDIWIEVSSQNAQAVFDALRKFGAPLQQLGLTVLDFQKEGYFVQLGLPPSRVDIMMSVSGLIFSEAWSRREIASYGSVDAFFISKADLITAKQAAGRPRDLLDIETLQRLKT